LNLRSKSFSVAQFLEAPKAIKLHRCYLRLAYKISYPPLYFCDYDEDLEYKMKEKHIHTYIYV